RSRPSRARILARERPVPALPIPFGVRLDAGCRGVDPDLDLFRHRAHSSLKTTPRATAGRYKRKGNLDHARAERIKKAQIRLHPARASRVATCWKYAGIRRLTRASFKTAAFDRSATSPRPGSPESVMQAKPGADHSVEH